MRYAAAFTAAVIVTCLAVGAGFLANTLSPEWWWGGPLELRSYALGWFLAVYVASVRIIRLKFEGDV